jgi:hypothetical protein
MNDIDSSIFHEQAEERRDAAEGETDEDDSGHKADNVGSTHVWFWEASAERVVESPGGQSRVDCDNTDAWTALLSSSHLLRRS